MSNQVNESKITYRQVGDYQIPNITLPSEETKVELGMWGMMYKEYLRKHKQIQFNPLVMKGILYQHCAEVERQAQEMLDRLIEQMAKAEGITEQLKAENQMEWVGRMNNVRTRARKIICEEIIYA